jgi:hypothetical protein
MAEKKLVDGSEGAFDIAIEKTFALAADGESCDFVGGIHSERAPGKTFLEFFEVKAVVKIVVADFVEPKLGGASLRIFCEPVALFLGVCARRGGVIAPETFLKFLFDSTE